MADLLLDTDVCIDHRLRRARITARRSRLGYSVVTRAELRAGARDDPENEQIRRFLGAMVEYDVDGQVADEAGRLRRDVGIRLPDALIAATALVNGLVVHTRNVSDFRRVPGLRLRSDR